MFVKYNLFIEGKEWACDLVDANLTFALEFFSWESKVPPQ